MVVNTWSCMPWMMMLIGLGQTQHRERAMYDWVVCFVIEKCLTMSSAEVERKFTMIGDK